MIQNNVQLYINGRPGGENARKHTRFVDAGKTPIYIASELRLVRQEESRFRRIVERAFPDTGVRADALAMVR